MSPDENNPTPPATPPAPKLAEARYRGRPYEMTDKGLLWWKPIKGSSHVPLLIANFNAAITEDLILDDSAETTRAFRIEATLGKRHLAITIPARQFGLMNWPIEHLGARAHIEPGLESRVRSAIIHLSQKSEERTMYRHTGWRLLDGQHVYLHAGGAIAGKGRVKVETQLSPALKHYELPEPRRRPEIARAVRASMAMLDIAPDRVTFPVFSTVWRSMLKESMFSVHIAGPTGAGKSQVAALAQQHFGAKMDGDHLPLAWSSTANAIEALLFEAKDAVLVVDDFVPTGSSNDQARLHSAAERVMRAQGNHSNRTRMTADISIRAPRPPQGILLSTGEDTPGTQSLRARQVIVELARGELDWQKLTACQEAAGRGVYAMAAAGFIRWLAPRLSKTADMMTRHLAEFRATTATLAGHRRTPDNVANLAAGFRMWLTFARHLNVLQPAAAAALWSRACQAFQDLIEHQLVHQVTSDPGKQFLALIGALFAGGRAHLASPTGGAPDEPGRYGWRKEAGAWEPQGPKIGWQAAESIYLDPHNSFAAAQTLGKETGQSITLSLPTLQRRLKQADLLAGTEKGRETSAVRVTLEATRRSVLHFSLEALIGYEKPDQPDHTAKHALEAQGDWSSEVAEMPEKPDQPDHPDQHLTSGSDRAPRSKGQMVRLVRFPKTREALAANKAARPAAHSNGRANGAQKQPKLPDHNLTTTPPKPDHNPQIKYPTAAERRSERLRKI